MHTRLIGVLILGAALVLAGVLMQARTARFPSQGKAFSSALPPERGAAMAFRQTSHIYAGPTRLAELEAQLHLVHDDLVSVVGQTDQGGAALRASFLPFGTQAKSSSLKRGFGGKETDTSGLANFGARPYAPALGRFTGPDPVLSSSSLYAYAADNPLVLTDPDGQAFNFAPSVAGDREGHLAAQLQYFDAAIMPRLAKAKIAEQHIGRIREMVRTGKILYLPGQLQSRGSIWGGLASPYEGDYYEVMIEENEVTQRVYSARPLKTDDPAVKITSAPVGQANVAIASEAHDDVVGAVTLHEYGHIVFAEGKYGRDIFYEAIDEFLQYNEELHYYRALGYREISPIPDATQFGIGRFLSASNPTYNWWGRDILIPHWLSVESKEWARYSRLQED